MIVDHFRASAATRWRCTAAFVTRVVWRRTDFTLSAAGSRATCSAATESWSVTTVAFWRMGRWRDLVDFEVVSVMTSTDATSTIGPRL